jgi:hypothetical protein
MNSHCCRARRISYIAAVRMATEPGFAGPIASRFRRRTVAARRAIHRGEHLAEELKAPDLSAAELGCKMDVATNRITRKLPV